jgi:hypothetical protein
MANAPVLKETDREVHAFRTTALAVDSFAAQASVAASTVSTTVLARKLLPIAAKIGVVSIYFTAITALTGTHAFNIVVGEGAETGTVGPADQTDVSGTPYAVGATVASGYAASGNQLWAVDQAITATAGVGAPLYQPALATVTVGTGGVLRFVPDVPDTIYPAGTVLTLRAVVPAASAITNFVVSYESVSLIPVKTQPSNNAWYRPGFDF